MEGDEGKRASWVFRKVGGVVRNMTEELLNHNAGETQFKEGWFFESRYYRGDR